MDLHHRQRFGVLAVAGQPRLNLAPLGLEGVPTGPVPVRAGRTDRRHHRSHQLVIHDSEPRLALQPGRLSCLHVPAGRLAVHPRPLGDRPQTGPLEPAAEHFPDLDHCNLPESHARRPSTPTTPTW